MKAADCYAYESFSRTFYEGYRLFSHLNHCFKGLAI